ncbi:ubiquitinyl hydrolase 1 [Tulasnella sp. JGI-2019a]|nr:ubiquitinyl hydrolase 1 [Tulasnella sp. JGI-2019a]
MTDLKPSVYRKHFIPLESNPVVFTKLIHRLGVPPSLAFTDVYSLDDPDLLAMILRPTSALILVFPTSLQYEQNKAADEMKRENYAGQGAEEDVIWFKQTINNACGLYGVLHCVSNGKTAPSITPSSTLSNLLAKCIPVSPQARALVLEEDEELEKAYTTAATEGDSAVPENPEDEVDFHYVAFIKSTKNGNLYLMDGDRKGPVDLELSLTESDDLLSEPVLEVVRKFIQMEGGENLNFSLMALGPSQNDDDD